MPYQRCVALVRQYRAAAPQPQFVRRITSEHDGSAPDTAPNAEKAPTR